MNKIILPIITIGLGVFLFGKNGKTSTRSRRQKLTDWYNGTTDPIEDKQHLSNLFLNVMTENEIQSVYEFIFDFFIPGITVPPDSSLFDEIQLISAKYNIFT